MLKVEDLLKNCDSLQVHYLSNESQNEFTAKFSDFVKQHVLGERKTEKCYAIIVDSTPYSSHAHTADESGYYLLLVYLVKAFASSVTECLVSSLVSDRRTAVCTSRLVMVDLML